MIPSWILDIFAAVMLAVAAVSAACLVAARAWQSAQRAVRADIDVAHLLMAIAMAGMLTARLHTLPNGAWAIIFGVLTAWFAYRVARDAQLSGVRALAGGHCAPHLTHAAAMLYMFLALAAPAAHGPGMAGMGGVAGTMGTLDLPFLAFLFALVLIGYVIWDLDQVSGPGATGHYSLATARVAAHAAVLASAATVAGTASPTTAAFASAVGEGGIATVTQAEPTGASEAAQPGGGTSPVLAPSVATGCRIAMGVTMAFMLLIMI